MLQEAAQRLATQHGLKQRPHNGAKPTKVAEILEYGQARPRTVETLSDAGFVLTKKRSLEIFQREVAR